MTRLASEVDGFSSSDTAEELISKLVEMPKKTDKTKMWRKKNEKKKISRNLRHSCKRHNIYSMRIPDEEEGKLRNT